jgi:hypothetical protein
MPGVPRIGPARGGRLLACKAAADVAQLVEHNLAKVGVAGSNPVVRSRLAAQTDGTRLLHP